MAEQIAIRPARLADLGELVCLERWLFPLDAFRRPQLRYLLTRAHATVLVADEAGQVRGSAVVAWRRGARTARLFSIAVAPTRQGRGLGKRLLEACEEEACRRRCGQLRLEVRVTNEPAVRLYEGQGYRLLQRLPRYYPDGADGLRMAKNLAPPQ